MSRHEPDATTIAAALELLTAHGFDGLARPLEMLLNEAMRMERSAFLGAAPWQRSDERIGYANGFKSKTVSTRLGELALEIPKTRDLPTNVEPFYPEALARGGRTVPHTNQSVDGQEVPHKSQPIAAYAVRVW